MNKPARENVVCEATKGKPFRDSISFTETKADWLVLCRTAFPRGRIGLRETMHEPETDLTGH